jgi:hypothetical protein
VTGEGIEVPEPAAGQHRALDLAARLGFPLVVAAYLTAFAISTRDIGFEARAFPLAVGTLCLIILLSIVVGELRSWSKVAAPVTPDTPPGLLLRRAGPGTAAAVLTAAFIGAAGAVGFFPALPLFLAAVLGVLGVRPWWVVAATTAAYFLATWVFFGLGMGLRLPTGAW